MWMILMIVLVLLTMMAMLYIGKRMGEISLIQKVTKGRKYLAAGTGLISILLIEAILWFAWGSMNAIICMLHLIVFLLLCDGGLALVRKYSKRKIARSYAIGIAFGFTICYLGTGWYLAHHVVEKDYRIQTDKKTGQLNVAVLADSHVGATFDGEGFAKHIKTIEAKKPDILLIAGDFVDDDTSKKDMIRSCKALGDMKTKYGVYYVFGNHDKGYYSPEYRGYSGEDLVKELEKNHVHVMQDQAELVDNRFYIVGRADKSSEYTDGRKTMKELTKNLDKDKYCIVLDHQPQDYKAQADANVDIVFSGHTHGGQLFPLMTIENLTKITPDDRVYGYEKRKNTNFIVTSGISDWAIKFKTGCRSEYLFVTIRGK